ncbi:hypothetical protein ACTFIR_008747 [Dictyostelium discoideum]
MSVLIETNLGDIVIDLNTEECPITCKNFLKLCKIKYYNFCLFYNVQKDFLVECGDPSNTGKGGESIYGLLYGNEAKYFQDEIKKSLRHNEIGTVAMANTSKDKNDSKFYITLKSDLNELNDKHTIFGRVVEGIEVLNKINSTFSDSNNRPLQNIRILHTIILDDPFPDPNGLSEHIPNRSPKFIKQPTDDRFEIDEDLDKENRGKTKEEINEIIDEKDAKSRSELLEMIGALPSADIRPPDHVLFVCKLNPITEAEELELVFSQCGTVKSCEVVRDKVTNDSLCYAFVEYSTKEECEKAYLKLENILIDERRIHVDFCQSVAKVRNNQNSLKNFLTRGKGGSGGLDRKHILNKNYQQESGTKGYNYVDDDDRNFKKHKSNEKDSRERDMKSSSESDNRYKDRNHHDRNYNRSYDRDNRNRDDERDRDRDRYSDRDRERDRYSDRDRYRDRDRYSDRYSDRDNDRNREKDRYRPLGVPSKIRPGRYGEICSNCTPKKSYLDFSLISPTGFELVDNAELEWTKDFPSVKVSVNGSQNPVIMGQTHHYSELLENVNFFNITGRTDIKSLMHYSCGNATSSVVFEFTKPVERFLLLIFGVNSEVSLVVDSYDAYGYPVNMLNWDTLDHGLLSTHYPTNTSIHHPPAVKQSHNSATLDLTWSNKGFNTYIILEPNQMISKIILSVKGVHCNEEICKGQALYYSLVALGDCQDSTLFAVGNYVFFDVNRDGIHETTELFAPNVKVELYDAISSTRLIASTFTDLNGKYFFDNLPEGAYVVKIYPPSGYMISSNGPDNVINAISSFSNSFILTINGTNVAPVPPNSGINATYWNPKINGGITLIRYAISGNVCNDHDDNGVSDGNLSGITVQLTTPSHVVLKTAQTDYAGNYVFDDLSEGVYSVHFILPEGYYFSTASLSRLSPGGYLDGLQLSQNTTTLTQSSSNILILPTTNHLLSNVNICMKTKTFALSGFTFKDANGDGLYSLANQDLPLPGVVVQLFKSGQSAIPLATTTTDSLGKYFFDLVVSGDYDIHFNAPVGYHDTKTTSQSLADSNGWIRSAKVNDNTVVPNTNPSIKATDVLQNQNAGFALNQYGIGSYVWLDSNRDSERGPTETTGVSNVTVNLLLNGVVVATTKTSADGSYSFDGLAAGVYNAQFILPSNLYKFSPQFDESRPDTTGLVQQINLTPQNPQLVAGTGLQPYPLANKIDPTVNAGVYLVDFAIGDLVWIDKDSNGVLNPATDQGAPFVTINLVNEKTSELLTTQSAQDGSYSFNHLAAGNYCIHFVIPQGYKAVTTSYYSVGDENGEVCFTLNIENSDSASSYTKHYITPLLGDYIDDTLDQGIVMSTFAIGDFVFIDSNRDGLYQSSTETPAEGVKVVLSQSGHLVADTLTDSKGHYVFDNLQTGVYDIAFIIPPGYQVTSSSSDNKASSLGLVSSIDLSFNDDQVTPVNPSIDGPLKASFIDRTIDAGLVRPLFTIGTHSWIDENNNLIDDDISNGLPNITMTLINNAEGGKVVQTVSTDSKGQYSFTNVPEGDYCVVATNSNSSFSLLPKSADSPFDAAGKYCFVLVAGDSPSKTDANIGYTTKLSVGQFIWVDSNNDGSFDKSKENLLSNTLVTVTITNQKTGQIQSVETSNGDYQFIGLLPGDYCVQMTIPDNFKQVVMSVDSPFNSSAISCFNLNSTSRNDINLGLIPLYPIGDKVWLDPFNTGKQLPDSPGISNIPLSLISQKSNQIISSVVTDSNGKYQFEDVPPGEYCIEATINSDQYSLVNKSLDSPFQVSNSNNVESCFTVSGPLDNQDLGLTQFLEIGTFVWVDGNGNNLYETSKNDILKSNISITLTNIRSGDSVSTITDSEGKYNFNHLLAGDYCIKATQPVPYQFVVTSDDSVVDSKGEYCFKLTQSNPNINIGLVPLNSIGSVSWLDKNNDGKKEDNEFLPGVELSLQDSNGKVIQTITTDSDGNYYFDNLLPGDYCIVATTPIGSIPVTGSPDNIFVDDSPFSSDNTIVKSCFTVSGPLDNQNLGLLPFYEIGTIVWIDSNNNDKFEQPSDIGKSNVSITLTNSGNGETSTIQTNVDGNIEGVYNFNHLLAGDYCIKVTQPDQYQFVVTSDDSVVDSTGEYCFKLTESNPNINIGLVPLNSIGSVSWLDKNNDGKKEDNEFLPGVELSLQDSNGKVIQTITTDSDGNYYFDNLLPGDYCIVATTPIGSIPVTGSPDNIFVDGKYCLTFTGPQPIDRTDVNPGFVSTLDIGQYVWIDKNNNGKEESDEPLLPDVQVIITSSNGTKIADLVTDENGKYALKDQVPGSYCVQMVIPDHYKQVAQSEDSPFDSDVKYCFDLDDESITNANLGLVPLYPIGDTVWLDPFNTGKRTDDSPGVEGIELQLVDKDGKVIQSTTSGPDGKYQFEYVEPGDYCIEATIPNDQYKPVNTSSDSPFSPTPDNSIVKSCFTVSGPLDNQNLGLSLFYEIGTMVWIDSNNNGKFEQPSDVLKSDVSITLTNSDNGETSTIQTDVDGNYNFNHLLAGDYCIKVTQPDQYQFVVTSDDSVVDSAGEYCFKLAESDPNINIGLVPLNSIGSVSWLDKNNNGKKEDNEFLPGVELSLQDSNGKVLDTITTDESGNYKFDNLLPGDYCIVATTPIGSIPVTSSPDNLFVDDKYCLTFTGPQPIDRTDVNPGFVSTLDIGQYVWIDKNNNGKEESDEPLLPGVQVIITSPNGTSIANLVTDENGKYALKDQVPGSYCVQMVIPPHYKQVTQSEDSPFDSDVKYCFDLDDKSITNANLGLIPLFNVGDKVWLDPFNTGKQTDDSPPLSDITIRLTDKDGKVIQSTTSGPDGKYQFEDVPPSDYCVEAYIPKDQYKPVNTSSDSPFSVDSTNDNFVTVKYCFAITDQDVKPPIGVTPFYEIGTFVWIDSNNNDKFEQPSDIGKSNVPITLTNSGNGETSTIQTDVDGNYNFNHLLAGDYCIKATQPDQYQFVVTSDDSVVDSTGEYCFKLTQSNPNINIGLVPLNSIGSVSWLDKNNDGKKEDNEFLPGVELSLQDSNGKVLDTTTTDESGNYKFDNLLPGDYCIVATTPIGSIPVTSSPDNLFVDDKYCLTFTGPQPIDRYDVNPGFVSTLDIGQYVWIDKNNNGKEESDEPLLPGVQVIITSSNGTKIADLVTDENGKYALKDQVPGSYCVQMVIPPHYKQVAQSEDSPFDSDVKYCFDLVDKSITNANLGLVPLFNVGDKVWLDPFNTGKQTDDSPPLSDITIRLTDKDGNEIANTKSGPDGKYQFEDVPPGDYCVEAYIPKDQYKPVNTSSDSPFSVDSTNDNYVTVKYCFTITDQDVKPPIGVTPFYEIGTMVWIDSNNNDKFEQPSDIGKSNVSITLTNSGNGETSTIQTDVDGNYNFNHLLAGDYCIKATQPDQYQFVVTSDDSVVDSTGDYCFKLTQSNPNINIGLVPLNSIGSVSWLDKNNDGKKEDNEFLPGVELSLQDSNGKVLDTTTTDESGNYKFDNLLPGDYCIVATTPIGSIPVTGSPDNLFVNNKYCLTFTGPQPIDRTDVNPGFVSTLDIGQYVWIDKNNNGKEESDEPLLPGVQVIITSSNGTKIADLVTDENGKYALKDQVPGSFCVQMVIPDHYKQVNQSEDSPFDSNVKYCFDLEDKSITNANLGLVPLYNLGDTVWLDPFNTGKRTDDSPGVEGVPLTLIDKYGNSIQSTASGPNGKYQFEDVPPGDYCIEASNNTSSDSPFSVVLPLPTSSIEPIKSRYCFTVTEPVNNANLGLIPFLEIGTFVWIDSNNNDKFEQPSDIGKSDVSITLTNSGNGETSTIQTDVDGNYNFNHLLAGDYCIKATQPNKYQFVVTSDDSVVNSTGEYCFKLTQSNPNINIGLVPLNSIGSFAWLDKDNDGLASEGESLPGVELSLQDSNGKVLDTTTTDESGDYCIVATTPIGSIPVTSSPDNLFVNNKYCLTFTGPQPIDRYDVNPGFVSTLDIGQYVWIDKNNNGKEESDEPLLPDVQVIITSSNGTKIADLVTDENGKYALKDQVPGSYCVQMVIPDHYKQVAQSEDSPFDSDVKYCFDLVDESITNANLGLVPLYPIGDTVWLDPFNTGKRTDDSPGVEGIELQLVDKDGKVIQSTTSGPDGKYQFEDVPPGDYCVEATIPKDQYKPVNTSSDSPFSSDNTIVKSCFTVSGPLDNQNLGLSPFYEIGTFVWIDSNNNDKFEQPSDIKKSNVSITLTNSGNGETSTIQTDSNGNYQFNNLLAGDYCIKATQPNKYQFVVTSDDSVVGQTGEYCFKLTQSNPNINIGLVPLNSIGSVSWLDKNNNGNREDNEFLPGVELSLQDSNGKVLDTTTTDESGNYKFDNLLPGDYCIVATTPIGSIPVTSSPDNLFVNDKYCLTFTGPQPIDRYDVNPGFVSTLDIGQYVWIDKNNNGKESDEPLLPGVQVIITSSNGTKIADLVTDENGKYALKDQVPGSYCVQMVIPPHYKQVAQSEDSPFDSDVKYCFDLVDKSITNANLGLVPLFNVGDKVWLDPFNTGKQTDDSPPLSDITIRLTDKDGNEIANTKSGPDGKYQFEDVPPGDYCVEADIPKDQYKPVNTSSDSPFSVDSTNDNFVTVKYCFTITDHDVKPSIGVTPFYEIGTIVWIDSNNNDKFEQPSDIKKSDVSITLTNSGNGETSTIQTDVDGNYNFNHLLAGDYCIKATEPNQYQFVVTSDDSVVDSTGDYCFKLTQSNPNINIGLVPLNSIGSVSWLDKNNDGKKEDNEFLPGVELSLQDSNGKVLETITTDESGNYKFDNLLPGDYCIVATTPIGSIPVTSSPDNLFVNDKYCLTFTGPQPIDRTDVNPGFVSTLDIGQYVWIDKNNNGKEESDEPLLPGVQVIITSSNGTKIADLVTDENGKYALKDQVPGSYCVQMVIPDHYKQVAQSEDSPFDSDVKYCFDLVDESITNANLGLVPLYPIGDTVWLDPFNTGKRTDDSPGVEGIELQLVDKDGKVIQSTTSGPDGKYQFEDVPPGDYCIEADIPNDQYKPVNTSSDSPFSPTSDESIVKSCFTVSKPLDNQNLGLSPFYEIGTIVWIDSNNNDKFEQPSDIGKSDVSITLTNSGNGETSTIQTDVDGNYNFNHLLAGDYCIKATEPNKYQFVVTSDDSVVDSTGEYCFKLTESNPNINIGLVPLNSIGSVSWLDKNNNGKKEDNEFLPGVELSLQDSNGKVLDTTTTDESGNYKFDNLLPGDYCIVATTPIGSIPVTSSPDNLFVDNKYCLTFTGQQPIDRTDVNPGFVSTLDIGQYVWIDKNNNGKEESDEPLLSGVQVIITSPNGTKIADLVTDENGKYALKDQVPGSYCVQMVIPPHYKQVAQSEDSPFDSDVKYCFDLVDESITNANLGLIPLFNVGDKVWLDPFNTGKQTDDSPPLSDITIRLTDKDGNEIANTKSGPDGKYQFEDVPPGDYCVEAYIPKDQYKPVNTSSDSPFSVDSTNDNFVTVKYCFTITDHDVKPPIGVTPFYEIGTIVWIDSNNNDKFEQPSDIKKSDVSITLTNSGNGETSTIQTDVDGNYNFNHLLAGDYCIKATQPDQYQFVVTSDDSVVDSTGDYCFKLTQSNPNINIGLVPLNSIGSFAWLDKNNDGQVTAEESLPGVELSLQDSNGKVLETITTDESGNYKFDNLLPGDYCIVATTPIGSIPVTGSPDNLFVNNKYCLTFTGPQPIDRTDVNPGFVSTLDIGQYVWIDKNNNGKEESDEPLLSGVQVIITSPNGTKIADLVTDENGKYALKDQVPESYCVQMVIPDHYKQVNQSEDSPFDSNVKYCFDLEDKSITNANLGLVPLYNLGDKVWLDPFNTGKRTDDSPGVEGIPLTLIDKYGNSIQSTASGPNGKYQFEDVPPGDYCIEASVPRKYQAENTSSDSPFSVVLPLPTSSIEPIKSRYCFTVTEPVNNANLGLIPFLEIGTFVWIDSNNNDKFEQPSDIKKSDVSITLTNSGNGETSTIQTDSNGNYQFNNLLAGDYCIKATQPNKYQFVVTSDDSVVNSTGEYCFKLTQSNPNINIGLVPLNSIGTFAWLDKDNDGLATSGESLPDVELSLQDPNGTVFETTTTDESGYYLFYELLPGNYCIVATTPIGSIPVTGSPDNLFVNNKYCLTFTGPQPIDRYDVNPGFVSTLDIGQYVWIDKNNNGKEESDEPLLPGVQVIITSPNGTKIADLVTDENGKYALKDQVPESYCVQMVIPPHYKQVAQSEDSPFDSDVKYCFDLVDESITNANLGLVPLFNVGDKVWLDPFNTGKQTDDSPPLSDITIRLTDKDGNEIANTKSGPDGKYQFEDVPPGDYCVEAYIPKDQYKPVNTSSDSPFSVDSTNDNFVTVKYCFTITDQDVKPPIGVTPFYEIGTIVWIDSNNNYKFEQPSDIKKSDVSITLTNSGNGETSTIQTDVDGNYNFNHLLAGDYCIKATQPNKYQFVVTSEDSVVDSTGEYCFKLTQSNPNINIGLVPLNSIGSVSWLDKNNDGKKEDNEFLPGVELSLQDSNGKVLDTTTTDESGNYKFDNLLPGDYCIVATTPIGSIPVTSSPDNLFVDDKYCLTFTGPQPIDRTDVNPGFVSTLDIGQYVWIDKNNNGKQESDEPLLPGVQVIITSPNGTKIADLVTDENGKYALKDQVPGSYCVQMVIPDHYKQVAQSEKSPFDSDVKYCFDLVDESITNANLGLVPLYPIGDTVWLDPFNTGKRTDDSPGVEGIQLNLVDKDGKVIQSTASGPDGKYQFEDVPPGDYCIEGEFPNDTYQAVNTSSDSPFSPTSDESIVKSCFKVSGPLDNQNLGLSPFYEIGTIVWIDSNNNDKFEQPSDIGKSDVSITLTNSGNGETSTIQTDVDGNYNFNHLLAGDYCIKATQPDQYQFVVTSDDSVVDSTGDYCFKLTESNPNINIGLVPLNSIGSVSWLDKNNNGKKEDNEFLPGVELSLQDSNGKVLDTTTTDESGNYKFDNLLPGDYCIVATTPIGSIPVTGSPDNLFVNNKYCLTFTGPQPIDRTDVNPGFVSTLDIGQYVWIDKNNNGKEESDEPLLPGVQVIITSPNGTKIADLVTDENGKYALKDQVPGSYCVQMVIPPHYKQVAQSEDSPFDSNVKHCFDLVDKSITNANLGLVPLYPIGDKVWLDPFNTGIQLENSPGIPNIVLTLTDKNGNTIIKSIPTDDIGKYQFDDVEPGDYCIKVSVPSDYSPVNKSSGSPFSLSSQSDVVSCLTVTGPTDNQDLGLIPLLKIGTIVWIDSNNNDKFDTTK